MPYLLSRLDEYGGPNSYPNYAVGWAMAGSTPVHAGHHDRARRRQHGRHGRALAQGHQSQGRDAPPVPPRHRHRPDDPRMRSASPSRRSSMAFRSCRCPASACATPSTTPNAADRHITQYNESIGNRSIYHDGWLAAVVHMRAVGAPAAAHRRLLARTSGSCTTCARTSAWPTTWPAKYPEKLEEMKALFIAGGAQEQRLPDRRPRSRAPEPGSRRPPRHHVRPHRADALPGYAWPARGQLHQHQGRVVHHRRGTGDPRRRRRGRHSLPRPASSAAGAYTSRTASPSTRTTGSRARSTRSKAPNRCPQARCV